MHGYLATGAGGGPIDSSVILSARVTPLILCGITMTMHAEAVYRYIFSAKQEYFIVYTDIVK